MIRTHNGPAWAMFHGDSVQILRSMPGEVVDAVIADPPYSSGGAFRGDRCNNNPRAKYQNPETKREYPTFAGDNRDQRAFAFWAHLWLSESLRVARPGSPIAIFADWRQLPLMTDLIQSAGWVWRGVAVWDKTEGCRPQKGRYRAQAEYIIWGSKGEMLLERNVPALPGVFRHVVRQADKHHLTGKPTGLMRDVVRICRPGGVVLDMFAGSATTGVAALLEGMSFVGIESETPNLNISLGRLREHGEYSERLARLVGPVVTPVVNGGYVDSLAGPREFLGPQAAWTQDYPTTSAEAVAALGSMWQLGVDPGVVEG